jgi:Flp pilus assembly protein TadG
VRTFSLRREEGQAAVEMALVLPILVVLLLAIAQFGIAFNNYVTLTDATRAGARKAAVSRFIGDGGAAAQALVLADASGVQGVSATVTAEGDNWSTPGVDVVVTATAPYSINILGWTVRSGNLTSTTTERLE